MPWYIEQAPPSHDRLYRLRIAGDVPVVTSVRARCLAASNFDDALTLYLAADGTPQALDYHSATTRSCDVHHTTTATLKDTTPVHVGRPLILENPIVIPPSQAKAAAAGAKAPPQAGGAPAVPGGKATPPEEKTWLQRNWIYLIPLFFVGMMETGGWQQDTCMW